MLSKYVHTLVQGARGIIHLPIVIKIDRSKPDTDQTGQFTGKTIWTGKKLGQSPHFTNLLEKPDLTDQFHHKLAGSLPWWLQTPQVGFWKLSR